jgi:dethiobiotin synthetase
MSLKLFITGTDTDVGKTYVSVKLLRAFARVGLTTVGLKPVASGCDVIAGERVNADTVALQQAATVALPAHVISPFRFLRPISPHLAAEEEQMTLSCAALHTHVAPGLQQSADVCVIEGVGGWLVPINAIETMADFVLQQQLPVVLVVAMRLGCLNHAQLTAQAIMASGLRLCGWIANCLQPSMLLLEANVATLVQRLPAPLLGVMSYNGGEDEVVVERVLGG